MDLESETRKNASQESTNFVLLEDEASMSNAILIMPKENQFFRKHNSTDKAKI